MMFHVISPGPLATLQDNGRHGYAHIGVPPSGAADMASHALANRLVGNDPSCATLESTLGGLRLESDDWAFVAVTGAATDVKLGKSILPVNSAAFVRPKDQIAFGVPMAGARNYLAVRGGFDAPPTLGSRSTDLLSGLGPPPLSSGDALTVGGAFCTMPMINFAPVHGIHSEETALRFRWGPRDDWFTELSRQGFSQSMYRVEPNSNRIAVRLEGTPLQRIGDNELPSEGILTGCIQVPSEGVPLIFCNDHPTTGGYPVIGVVHPLDLAKAAQLRPGDRVRFDPVDQRFPHPIL